MTKRLLAIAAAALVCLSCKPSDNRTESLLRELDATLEMAPTYNGYFLQRVDVLRQLLSRRNSPEQEFDIRNNLAEEFSAYSMDSTLFQLRRNQAIATRLKDAYRLAETDLRLAREYALAGYHSDAMEILSTYSPESVPKGLEYTYYEVANYLYGEMAVYSSHNAQYWQKRDALRRSMLPYLEEGTYEWYDQQRIQADAESKPDLALELAMKALEVTTPNSRQYARAAFFVSTYHRNNREEQMYWLAKSAIADVMCATKDYASLNDLAKLLYENGDVDRAFKYVADHCMPDALFFNGKLRPWQIAQFFPALEQAYASKNARATRTMLELICVTLLLLVALAAALFYLGRRQRALVKTRKALESEKEDLQEANKVRQEYIGLFLQNLSENISTSRQYKNHVLKYIRRGNDKYLIEEIEALPPIEEDISEFNRMFDKTFINLYPDFVEKFNSLLAEGEAITPKGDDILTPELRVFALIKLGISESSRIASLLHYSSNTVYNYRAKIKNKALGDREQFEEAVCSIE